MCYCYVIKCCDGSYYIGSTRDISRRLHSHKTGKVKYTKNKRPIDLIFLKEFEDYNQAFHFEMRVKSWKKRKSIERMLDKPDNIKDIVK